MRRVQVHALLVALSLAIGVVAPVVALSPTLSLAELQRWFEAIPNARVVMAAPHEWQYSFVAKNARSLELLSQALIRDGYRILTLEGGERPTLRMVKTDLHSPLTLAKRNESLVQTARDYGAAYEGWTVAL